MSEHTCVADGNDGGCPGCAALRAERQERGFPHDPTRRAEPGIGAGRCAICGRLGEHADWCNRPPTLEHCPTCGTGLVRAGTGETLKAVASDRSEREMAALRALADANASGINAEHAEVERLQGELNDTRNQLAKMYEARDNSDWTSGQAENIKKAEYERLYQKIVDRISADIAGDFDAALDQLEYNIRERSAQLVDWYFTTYFSKSPGSESVDELMQYIRGDLQP